MNIISLGAGVQSTTMLLMAARGEIDPMPDAAIFADTHHEPKAVYEHLEWLESLELPFSIYRVSAGDLWESATKIKTTLDDQRSYIKTGIPIFTVEGLRRGIGRRQCTRDFKINPVNRKIKELLGVKRVKSGSGILATVWIGISRDEAHRAKPNRQPYIETRWPLLEARMSRQDCLDWVRGSGYPEPPRSACTFCPFRDNSSWRALTEEEFSDAAEKEKDLQASYEKASAMRAKPYLHSSRVPLEEVDLAEDEEGPDLFGNECEGFCGN